jgi:peptide chain release factor 2
VRERSQAANKQKGLARLKAKLVAVAETQRAADVAAIRGDAVKAEWGQQIRNYVFHPYKMVKDVRTGYETSDVDGVVNGNLDDFMDEFLRWKRKTEAEEEAELAANSL